MNESFPKHALAALIGMAAAGAAAAADIEAGKAKTGPCAGCHGADGISAVPSYPNLAGQHAMYLAKALQDYKSGARDNPVMKSMASGLSDADIDNIAAYYESLKCGK